MGIKTLAATSNHVETNVPWRRGVMSKLGSDAPSRLLRGAFWLHQSGLRSMI